MVLYCLYWPLQKIFFFCNGLLHFSFATIAIICEPIIRIICRITLSLIMKYFIKKAWTSRLSWAGARSCGNHMHCTFPKRRTLPDCSIQWGNHYGSRTVLSDFNDFGSILLSHVHPCNHLRNHKIKLPMPVCGTFFPTNWNKQFKLDNNNTYTTYKCKW